MRLERAQTKRNEIFSFPFMKMLPCVTQVAISRDEGSHSKSRKRGRVHFKQDESG